MSDGHIFLVGFMGSGKSTVARLVAAALGRPCIDLDDMLEEQDGRAITRIFAEDGEQAFRAMETAALAGLETHVPAVVACGGGVVVDPANRAALKRMGTVVYLRVTPGEALARIGDAGTRPLLAGSGGTLAATSLMQARETLYASVADMTVDTMGHVPAEVAEEIVAMLGETR